MPTEPRFYNCPKCVGDREATWVGYSPRARRSQRPIRDVLQCKVCGAVWWYGRTGRPVRARLESVRLPL